MKQTRLWLTTIAVLLCSITASAHDFSVNGIYYSYISGNSLEVRVTYKGKTSYEYSNEYSGNIVIPKEVFHNNRTFKVVSIGLEAFYFCSELTSITIPNSIRGIGKDAFYGCI